MNYHKIILELSKNKGVFRELLSGIEREDYLWRYAPGKWNLLEIVCHLYDEEREDFRARLRHVLETPGLQLPAIDPLWWVKERKYSERDYPEMLNKFLSEREQSVKWLLALKDPEWDNAYHHSKFGEMTAKMFLTNWLAHDYLHFRQIVRVKFEYLKYLSGETLGYAGEW